MIMIIDERCYPRDKTKFVRVEPESVPKDAFGGLRRKCRKAIAAARRDKVNLVVDEPMLVAFAAAIFGVVAARQSFNAFGHVGRL